MTKNERGRDNKLTTLSRGLEILEFVATAKQFVRLSDVAERFGIDPSGALRYLRTLELDGYLVRHQAMKFYSLGPKLLSFPRLSAEVDAMIQLARPVLAELARATGQMSHLGVLSGAQAVLVEVAATDAPVSVKQAVGDLEPLYSSAVGKALYAFLPEQERSALGARIDFRAHTERTITSLAGLERECQEIRASGVAFDRQEGNEHVACVGRPVLNRDGYPLASVGLSYVSAHLPTPLEDMTEDIALLGAAVRQIETALRDTPNRRE